MLETVVPCRNLMELGQRSSKNPVKKKQTNYSRRLKFPETSETFVDSLLLKWYLSNETAQEVLTWGIPRSYQFHSISGQLQNNPKPHI
jgi:hypothetical protein